QAPTLCVGVSSPNAARRGLKPQRCASGSPCASLRRLARAAGADDRIPPNPRTYSARSATIGSTRDARRAGNSVAATPTMRSNAMIAAYVAGSLVVTPYSSVLIILAHGSVVKTQLEMT